jgi:hypothetical protein
MDVRSMCVDNEIGELPDDLPTLSKSVPNYPSPPASTTLQHIEDIKSTKSTKNPRKKNPTAKQSNFLCIAPKHYNPHYPRYHKPWAYARDRSPPLYPPPRAVASVSKQTNDTSTMRDVDLQYMRMTPAERVAFKIPGTSVFQCKKCPF